MASLSGTGRLADDLSLMAHNDVTGRPYLQPRATGIGLAGALLAELTITGNLDVIPQEVAVISTAPPGDRLLGDVLGQIAGEREPHAPGEWLQVLAHTATAGVAQRLAGAGYLRQVSSRLPWRAGRWVPSDSDCAFMPLTRARAALDASRPVSVHAAALAGLAAACGLETRLLAYAPPARGRRSPQEAAGLLPPALREVVAQTQAAVDTAVMALRA
jgi:Golgi phosphoprotein 3 (GPP34)